jgi:hypothetical protein
MKLLHESPIGKLAQLRWSDYRGTSGINPSSLAEGLRGHSDVDVRAIHAAMTGTRKEPAQASQDRMDRGSLLHMALLQPERLASDVAVWDGKIRKGAEWDAFEHDNEKKLILRRADFDQTMSVYNEVKNHPLCGGKLRGCHAEVAMMLTDCGELCRGQVDAVDIEQRRIIDVKTTDAGVSEDSCERTIRSLHYREKMALYRRWIALITGTEKTSWRCWNLFISMDETSPAIALVRMTDDALEWGEDVMINALRQYSDARKANAFPIFAMDYFVDVKPWEVDPDPEVEIEF